MSITIGHIQDIWATKEVMDKLQDYFGEGADIRKELNIDGFDGVGPGYIGPDLPEVEEDETVDFWGIVRKKSAYEGGEYDEAHTYGNIRS